MFTLSCKAEALVVTKARMKALALLTLLIVLAEGNSERVGLVGDYNILPDLSQVFYGQ